MTRTPATTCSILLTLVLAAGTTARADLLLHSSLDDADTTTGSNGVTNSAPGATFDGTLNGTVPSVTGQIAEGRDFDGSDANFISYGDNADVGTGSYTASIWFNLDSISGTQLFFSKGNSVSGDNGWSMWFNTFNGGTLYARGEYTGSNNATENLAVSRTTPATGGWHHLALVLDNASGNWIGYFDGMGSGVSGTENGWSVGGGGGDTNVFTPGRDFSNADNLLIGRRSDAGTPFDGQNDDAAVWNEALSVGEVRALFTMGSEPDLQFDAGEVNELIEAFGDSEPLVEVGGFVWRLVDDGSLEGSAGDLIELPLGNFAINFGGGNGFTTFVPEPSALPMIVPGLLALCRSRCRVRSVRRGK